MNESLNTRGRYTSRPESAGDYSESESPTQAEPFFGGASLLNDSNQVMDITIEREQPKMRELTIRELNRGFVVTAGCHTFAISTAKELTELVTEYINNPRETEEKWFSGKLMSR